MNAIPTKDEARRQPGNEVKQKQARLHPNSSAAQRRRIAEHLLVFGSLDTETARRALDVYCPPARVMELRRMGWQISTVMVDVETPAYGRVHRIGRYLLVKAPQPTTEAQHG